MRVTTPTLWGAVLTGAVVLGAVLVPAGSSGFASGAAPHARSSVQGAATPLPFGPGHRLTSSAGPTSESVRGLRSFRVDAVGPVRVPADRLPLRGDAMPLVPEGRPMGTDGIVKYRHRRTGVLHDHPVVQATHILGWLESYRRTGDRRFLDLAVRHGDHLTTEAVHHQDADFFPYPFDFALHGDDAETLRGPWYSAMAQGEVLAAYVRLASVTGDTRWTDSARRTFASFTVARRPGEPWVADVDDRGLLWLEEYPDDAHPDRAFNGHNFALFGIYEYWWATGDPDAAAVLRGGMTATLGHVADIRREGELSRYCLGHDVRSESYHGVHVRQLYALAGLSGDPRFARWADLFLADAPAAYRGGGGRMLAGTQRLVSRGTGGVVEETSDVTLARTRTVTVDRREKIPGADGIWLHLADGPHAGRWVREEPGRAFLSGRHEDYAFSPARSVDFADGTYVGFDIDGTGHATVARRATLSTPSSALATGRVLVDGVTYLRMSTGTFAGRYVPLDGNVTVR